MTTDERLEKLEHELTITKNALRRNRQILFLGILAGLGCLTMAAVKDNQVIRAREFIVPDEGGGGIVLTADKDGPSLTLGNGTGGCVVLGKRTDQNGMFLSILDNNNQERVHLGTTDIGSGLLLSDEDGKLGARLSALKDGSSLQLIDKNGKPRVGLRTTGEGAALMLADDNDNSQVNLTTSQYVGSQLVFADRNGKDRARLGVVEIGNVSGAGLILSDKNGKSRVAVEEGGTAGPQMNLFDENGGVLR